MSKPSFSNEILSYDITEKECEFSFRMIYYSGLGFFRKKPISSRTPGRNWKKLEESGLFRKKVEEIGIK